MVHYAISTQHQKIHRIHSSQAKAHSMCHIALAVACWLRVPLLLL